jgi:Molybdopterin-binding domain of aldehyde dehydrogenase
VQLVNYTAVDDVGTVINPMIVEGQLHGGIVQRIGQAVIRRCSVTRVSSLSIEIERPRLAKSEGLTLRNVGPSHHGLDEQMFGAK